jgi:hypothetical protein
MYDAVFFIGMIAETGHFVVKRQAYDDFLEGGDLESAEMMLFDIIDETTHVQYAHKWLPLLAERAGVDDAGYKERAAKMRKEAQQNHHENLREWANVAARRGELQITPNIRNCWPSCARSSRFPTRKPVESATHCRCNCGEISFLITNARFTSISTLRLSFSSMRSERLLVEAPRYF